MSPCAQLSSVLTPPTPYSTSRSRPNWWSSAAGAAVAWRAKSSARSAPPSYRPAASRHRRRAGPPSHAVCASPPRTRNMPHDEYCRFHIGRWRRSVAKGFNRIGCATALVLTDVVVGSRSSFHQEVPMSTDTRADALERRIQNLYTATRNSPLPAPTKRSTLSRSRPSQRRSSTDGNVDRRPPSRYETP